MKSQDKELDILHAERRQKTHASYFWGGVAAVSSIATIALLFTATLNAPAIVGICMGALAAAGAGMQSLSYDKEVELAYEKIDTHLEEKSMQHGRELELTNAVHSLTQEVNHMRANSPLQRSDGQRWQDIIKSQKALEPGMTRGE